MQSPNRPLHRRPGRATRRGSAAVEFSFWLALATMLLSGIIDFGWYMSRSEIVMRAARDGSRQGAAAEAVNDAVDNATAQANDTLDKLAYEGCTVSVRDSRDNNNLVYLTTVVVCPFDALIGLAPGLPDDIAYRFTMYTELQ